MKINLAPRSRVFNNVTATQQPSRTELFKLVDENKVSDGVTVSGSRNVDFICDLGSPYSLSHIDYYRQASATESILAYARPDENSDWESLSVTSHGTYIRSSVPSSNRYRYVRVVHSPSSGPSQAYELEVYSSDLETGFDSLDPDEVVSVDSGTSTLTVQDVSLRNFGAEDRSYFVILDPEEVGSSDVSVSLNQAGTFYTLHESGVNLPETFSFSSGYFINTSEVFGAVRPTTTSGTYYTPVIDLASLEGRRFFWTLTISGSGQIDSSLEKDSAATVWIRYSDTAPSGGWANGQLSNDSNWNVLTGSLPFILIPNHHIFDWRYRRYLQAKVEFSMPTGSFVQLDKIGVEEAQKVTVSGNGGSSKVYLKSNSSEYSSGKRAGLITWFFEEG